jgi:hypothetical protein
VLGNALPLNTGPQSRCSAMVLLATRLSPLMHATYRRVIILLQSPWPPTRFAPGRRLARGCRATASASRRWCTQVRPPVLGRGQEVLPRNPPDPLLLPQGDEQAARDGGAEHVEGGADLRLDPAPYRSRGVHVPGVGPIPAPEGLTTR